MDRTSLKAQLSQKIIFCLCAAMLVWVILLVHESFALRHAPYGEQHTVSILGAPLTTLERNLTNQKESLKFYFHKNFMVYMGASAIFGTGIGILSANRYKRIRQHSLGRQNNTPRRNKARP